MREEIFTLTEEELEFLLNSYPNEGKNSHIGNIAVKIVEKYFLRIDPNATFIINKNSVDLEVTYLGKTESYEIKGTESKGISWEKLKVSGQPSYDALIKGMPLIRVTNIRSTNMTLYFMKYDEDFDLIPEVRWAFKKK